MITLRRLIDREIFRSVAVVTLGFLALFFFFDLIEELKVIQQKKGVGYGYLQATVYLVLLIPNHIYELLPITVLIGTVFVMARLAQSSEFTILRTSGLGPYAALDDEHSRLGPVAVDVWSGWIFINLDPECEPLRDYLEPPFLPPAAATGLATMSPVLSTTPSSAMNRSRMRNRTSYRGSSNAPLPLAVNSAVPDSCAFG